LTSSLRLNIEISKCRSYNNNKYFTVKTFPVFMVMARTFYMENNRNTYNKKRASNNNNNKNNIMELMLMIATLKIKISTPSSTLSSSHHWASTTVLSLLNLTYCYACHILTVSSRFDSISRWVLVYVVLYRHCERVVPFVHALVNLFKHVIQNG